MNFLDAADAPIPVKIGDKTHQIPRLTLNQAAALLAKWSIEKRGELLARLKDSGADSALTLAALEDFDRRSKSLSAAIGWCIEPGKIYETIQTCAGDEVADKISVSPEAGNLSMELWGIDTKAEDDSAGKLKASSATG